MAKKKNEELVIGTELYRYVSFSGFHKFTVIGVHQYESVRQYVVRDEACSHGWKCELLIAEDSDGVYRFVSMLNDREGDSQSYWHNDDEKFFADLEEAKKFQYKRIISRKKEELQKAEELVSRLKRELKELEDVMK